MGMLARVNKAFRLRIQKRTITVNVAALTAAATSQVIADASGALPANAVVLARQVSLTEVFAGGGASSATIAIGATDDDGIMTALSVFTGVTLAKYSGTAGALAGGEYGGQTLGAKVVSDVNVNTLTTGAAVVTVWFVVLD